MASYANKARNSDQVTKEQGDQSRTLNAAVPNDRHGQREMAKRATLVDWAHAYADKCTVDSSNMFTSGRRSSPPCTGSFDSVALARTTLCRDDLR